jgi:predicted CXXCH cytochrome family protein
MKAMKAVLFMRETRPVARMQFGAVLGIRPGLRVFLFLVLGSGVLTAAAFAAAAPKSSGADTKPPSSDFVGSDACAGCHEEVAKKFADNPHTKMAEMHGAGGVTCENCHGPGKAHVDGGGDVTKIFNPAKHSNKEVDEKCLTCHRAAHPNFDRSPHAKANVGCISCHTIHGTGMVHGGNLTGYRSSMGAVHPSTGPEYLLKASQPGLCYSCHADQKGQFNMPIHHKVNEGLIKCTDCHDTHGTFNVVNLRNTPDMNVICTKCHTDVRGPFAFEHAPVRAEGCTTCHTPHGTQNPRLLNMPSIATLCNQCHSPVSAGGVHGLDAGSTTVTPCVTCHTMIHGSNASQAFIR